MAGVHFILLKAYLIELTGLDCTDSTTCFAFMYISIAQNRRKFMVSVLNYMGYTCSGGNALDRLELSDTKIMMVDLFCASYANRNRN